MCHLLFLCYEYLRFSSENKTAKAWSLHCQCFLSGFEEMVGYAKMGSVACQLVLTISLWQRTVFNTMYTWKGLQALGKGDSVILIFCFCFNRRVAYLILWFNHFGLDKLGEKTQSKLRKKTSYPRVTTGWNKCQCWCKNMRREMQAGSAPSVVS